MNLILTEKTFTMFAMKHYNNPSCASTDDFNEDLARIKYIKRLLRQYRTNGDLKIRLILNHIIIFYNVFGIEPATDMLFFKIEKDLHGCLKPFLIYLNYYRDSMDDSKIDMDKGIVAELRNFKE